MTTEEKQTLLLQQLDDYLTEQGDYLDQCIVKLTGRPHVPDEQNVAFLEVDDRLARPMIEDAVSAFTRDRSWPTLDYRECLHLIYRAHIARKVIQAVLRGDPQATAMKAALPDLQNREDTLRWFLVALWNLGGKAFLRAMGDDWLKTRGQVVDKPPDDSGQA